MARYDWGRGYGREPGYAGTSGGYGSEYASWGDASWPTWGAGRRRDAQPWPSWRAAQGARGYDRGVYGGDYPSYGGYPGGSQQGMYYGGRSGYMESGGRPPAHRSRYGPWGAYETGGGRYDAGIARAGPYRYDAGYGAIGRGRYDAGYAHEPFVPEEAYRRHPELSRRPEHGGSPWSGPRRGGGMGEMDDEEVRRAVRQSLHQDGWIRPERIQVAVNGGVVTLTGDVDDYMQARYAWDDAWETSGVRGVVNNLTVRTDQPQEQHGDVLQQSSGADRRR